VSSADSSEASKVIAGVCRLRQPPSASRATRPSSAARGPIRSRAFSRSPQSTRRLKDIHCAGNSAVDGAQSIAELELTAATLVFIFLFFIFAPSVLLHNDASAQHSHSHAQHTQTRTRTNSSAHRDPSHLSNYLLPPTVSAIRVFPAKVWHAQKVKDLTHQICIIFSRLP